LTASPSIFAMVAAESRIDKNSAAMQNGIMIPPVRSPEALSAIARAPHKVCHQIVTRNAPDRREKCA